MRRMIGLSKTERVAILVVVLVLVVFALAGRSSPAWAENQTVRPVAAGPAMSSASYNLDWDVTASGGGEMSSSSFTIKSTAGQAALGNKSSASYGEESGFWVLDFIRDLFLPLIMRN